MPHTRQPPETPSQILATATHDPSWTAILEEHPILLGSDWGDDTKMLKQMSKGMLPRLRATLDSSRPSDVAERDLYVDVPPTQLKPEAGQIRVLVCQPSSLDEQHSTTKTSPVIILFHGGGHTVGNPESELPLARLLVREFHAVVIMPAYRLAPEHTFPSSFNDGLEILKIAAKDITTLRNQTKTSASMTQTSLLPNTTVPSTYLIIGGTSAGATIATSINHLYHNLRITSSQSHSPELPPITSLFLSCGSCINSSTIPEKYKSFYLSRAQNESEPPLDKDLMNLFMNAVKTDFGSPVWSSFDQRGGRKSARESIGEDHMWMAGATNTHQDTSTNTNSDTNEISQPPQKVYFQVCGADMARDDSLIYERVLRTECGVETRMDLYEGFGHVFWGMGGLYPEMEMSKKRMRDSVEAVGWMIG